MLRSLVGSEMCIRDSKGFWNAHPITSTFDFTTPPSSSTSKRGGVNELSTLVASKEDDVSRCEDDLYTPSSSSSLGSRSSRGSGGVEFYLERRHRQGDMCDAVKVHTLSLIHI
eukprot:TRINITY_DN39810_c0_g1_i1.p1 TRINITY_DN39810_c0_g1~~TRINITY_DN39810_c0_g1_i1.p1  ORF type:complete len:129 (+),score=49.49 TRINITY_DN39810_c0_g1_i1:50-388(+)